MGSNKRRRRSICKGDGKMKIIEEFIDSLFSGVVETPETCLLYTSDAADDLQPV